MKTDIGKQYCVTSDSECEIVDTATNQTIHLHHAGEGQSYFTAIGLDSEPSDDSAIITPTFKGATAGNGSGGGYIESNLNVGHGAADAVAAVCTLTLGDLSTGGTLTDSNGQHVELENPRKYATGTVSIPDATAAGTIALGEHEAIEFEARPAVSASALLTMKDSLPDEIEFGLAIGGENINSFFAENTEGWTLDTLVSAINNSDYWTHAPEVEASKMDGKCLLTAKSEYPGSAGNSLEVQAWAQSPFTNPDTLLSGGVDARTPQEVVDALNASENCPAEAALSHVDEEDAKAVFTPHESYNSAMPYEFDVLENGVAVNGWVWNAQDGDTAQELVDALNDDHGQCWQNTRGIEATLEDGKVVLRRLDVHGAASNGYVIYPWANTPFMEPEETPIEGGSDESDTITFTAKEYGVNDEIAINGSMFSDAVGMSGGHGDYTVAELVTAISGEFSDITPAAGETEGTITLTATTAGKAANAVVYTSTGCFGGETAKQGSTTRGKDAVSKTSWQIVLNGEVLDVEPAPVPEPLEEDTTMKNHGVYLVTADATAQDFTGITLADNATAEIWLTCTSDDNSVALPGSTQGWIWLDAMPDMEAGKTYAVAARSVGNAVLARPIYDYTTPAQS